MSDKKDEIATLGAMIKGIRTAMLTTVDRDGSLRSRPMETQDREFDGTLWFFTADDSPKIEEIEQERQVNLSYADPDSQKYVSISGRATLVRDRKMMEELWTPFIKAWFPEGLDDPRLALLKVTAESAEYWSAPPSAVVRMVGLAKALVTGEQYDAGENEKIELRMR
jgi:general stress protein 26